MSDSPGSPSRRPRHPDTETDRRYIREEKGPDRAPGIQRGENRVDGTAGLLVTQLTRFGPLPMSVGGGVRVFVETPSGKPDWRLRVVATILLPRN